MACRSWSASERFAPRHCKPRGSRRGFEKVGTRAGSGRPQQGGQPDGHLGAQGAGARMDHWWRFFAPGHVAFDGSYLVILWV